MSKTRTKHLALALPHATTTLFTDVTVSWTKGLLFHLYVGFSSRQCSVLVAGQKQQEPHPDPQFLPLAVSPISLHTSTMECTLRPTVNSSCSTSHRDTLGPLSPRPLTTSIPTAQ